MPATATGRGAQVVIDPGSDAQRAIRGAYAASMEANAAKAATDALAGTLATGGASDGTTATGGRATDWATTPGGSGMAKAICPPVVSVGNGADLTEDVLQTFTIPANTLRNVGDIVRMRAGGMFGATTDTKIARIRVGGQLMGQANGSTVGATSWFINAELQKNGAGTQILAGFGLSTATNPITTTNTQAFPDTAAMTLTVTGQNTTNSVAGSVTCRYLTVEVVPA